MDARWAAATGDPGVCEGEPSPFGISHTETVAMGQMANVLQALVELGNVQRDVLLCDVEGLRGIT